MWGKVIVLGIPPKQGLRAKEDIVSWCNVAPKLHTLNPQFWKQRKCSKLWRLYFANKKEKEQEQIIPRIIAMNIISAFLLAEKNTFVY